MIDTHHYQASTPVLPGYGDCAYCPEPESAHDPSAVWNPTGDLIVPTSQLVTDVILDFIH